MSKISCIIVDDEPLARSLLMEHLTKLDDFEVQGEFKSAIDADNFLNKEDVDIIFLDINMPTLSGIDYLKNIKPDALVIFTTAYPEFAVEAFEYNAFDYLVKPISFNRFLKSMNKVKNHFSNTSSHPTQDTITFKENKRLYKIDQDDILVLEAYGDYVKIYTTDKLYTVKNRLSNYEKILNQKFIKTHRSYIINLGKVEFMEGNMIRIAEQNIPISNSHRDNFIEKYKA